MRKLLAIAFLAVCAWCITEDPDYFDKFVKIQVDEDFYYYHFHTENVTTNSPLVVVLTGYNPKQGGVDKTFSRILAEHMTNNKIGGTVISPYVYYVGDFTENFDKIQKVIDNTPHDEKKLYLVGGSMGAIQSLKYCQKWNAAAVVSIAGGSPIDLTICPEMEGGPHYSFGSAEDFEGVSICFLNGAFQTLYDEDKKYYYSDGILWVDPIINLYKDIENWEHFTPYKYMNLTLYGEEYTHAYMLVTDTTPFKSKVFLRWLFMQHK